MSKEIYISSTPHETRLAIVEKDELTEIYYERENEYTLAGSIYNGKVTRVLPGMQSSFVDVGLERDAFLYITDFLEEAGETDDIEGGESTPRNGEGAGRNGGRSRGRDRGRSDRNREAQPVEGSEARSAEDDGFDAAPRNTEGEEVGEGAPGADGSRRWRGRRGRRRGGRGDAPPSIANGEASTQTPDADRIQETRPPRDDRDRAPRGDRGGRDRDRGRGRSEVRDDRGRHEQIRERFAPRSTSRPGADEPVEISASAEPFLLPGESLSKYRRGEDAPVSSSAESSHAAPAPVLVTRPSTEIELTGWDGGSVLPGETLSRRSSSEPRNESRNESRNEPRGESRGSRDRDRGGRGNDRGRDRDARRGGGRDRNGSQRFSSAPRLDPAEAVLPAVTSQHEVTSSEIFSDDAPQFEVQETEQRLEAEHAAHVHDVQAAQQESVVEFHETTTEYEPSDEASASFRVDPAGPSEFRQSTIIEEIAEEPAQPRHEFTAVQPTGEMLSEQVPLHDNPASPIEHEAAVQSVTLAEAVVEAQPADSKLFAPGVGELEEELLDDEESDLPHVHASATQDDLEEETLEHAADLGSMLRDMSLDEMVRPEPAEGEEGEEGEEDEDDFEDDEELEEDELAATDEAEYEEGEELSGTDISEAEEEEFAEAESVDGFEPVSGDGDRQREPAPRDDARRGRRDVRRSGRDRGGRDRERSRSGGGDRRPGRSRHSAQATNLPAISDLLKPGQEVLVQIAKEPIAKKGARITSHIALPGRFLVFMPTVSHTGVSRKIESDAERRRLKEILLSEKGDASGGFIVRTAASGASEEELRSDLRFLLNLWAEIKTRSESSKSPALIYHDLNLVERILRDQVTDNFSAIWVDTETEYERVLRFLQRFQPALIRRVKLYTKETPLFEQFGITEEINKALRAKVWLKSGGSIVINQTEALVAIDINTGKYVGKTARLEDTILKTNLDAIPEIVRQIRLRDLGGIIIIDFIDMDERRNRNKVMAALEDELKKDRAPSKVLQFNDFGLVAITRKRVKQSLERTLSTTCGICTGTGMVKSPVTVCNEIYIELRKMHKHLEKGDIMLRVNPEVVKQLKSNGGKWLQEMEELSGKTILVKSDPALHPEQYDIH
jgi:ribonuclease G